MMKTALKIIRNLIEDKKQKTIREIARQIKADYRITYIAVQQLIEKNILTVQTVGKSSLCALNSASVGIEIYQAEDQRKKDALKNSTINQLFKELVSKLPSKFFILLLFGSHAKGTITPTSDVDLLFISNEKDFETKVSTILSLLPLKTHTLIFTEEEFVRMKDTKKPNVVQEAIKNNILLYGTEAYYLMNNA